MDIAAAAGGVEGSWGDYQPTLCPCLYLCLLTLSLSLSDIEDADDVSADDAEFPALRLSYALPSDDIEDTDADAGDAGDVEDSALALFLAASLSLSRSTPLCISVLSRTCW
eukprot:CAMPEP_0173240114 /NCGR_PEP_ID=MMETSP1142-20121109/13585_1 /TAXON_ID=483371 /ORGANISM="non described non described, Strain CCMP2298" /LENGTH=110 /DNA_ID=CAMNT_0014171197 /DNA_START=58 /DNA_END=394 /DNA_ORIENTATION=+